MSGAAPDRAGAGLARTADRAGRWAGRLLLPPGPELPRGEAAAVVAGLHAAAARALPLAERAGRLGSALDAAGRPGPAPVLVVDRPSWALAAARSMAAIAGPTLPTGPAGAAQLAGGLAVLGTRVLGQYDPYHARSLLLVAPTIVEVGRAMQVDQDDFALWVAVHEQTHALQFAAAPWLAEHLRAEAAALLESLGGPGGDLRMVLDGVVRVLRGADGPGLLLDDEQRTRLDRVTAVMALLEGHADVTMDDVPPKAIPSRRRLRARMTARRTAGGTQRVLRRLLGLDAKLAQYRDGARFVREVRRAGRDALDPVWATPDALPSAAEIADPAAWLRRTRP